MGGAHTALNMAAGGAMQVCSLNRTLPYTTVLQLQQALHRLRHDVRAPLSLKSTAQ